MFGIISAFLTTEGLSDCMSRPRKLGITKVGLEVEGSKMVNRLPKRCRVAKWRRAQGIPKGKRMKKLMIGAAVVALAAGAFASCSDSTGRCVAWDLSLNLKSLDAKKLSCKSACGDKSTLFYLDNASRKLKGFLWACDYSCDSGEPLFVVLWDTKKKIPVIPAPPVGDYTGFATIPVTFADWMVYGKKGNKVAGEFLLEDDRGSSDISVNVAGLNGSVKTGCNDCYIKSLSGQAAGRINVGAQYGVVDYTVGGLCGDHVVEICEDDDVEILYVTLCEICCGFNGWCDDGAVLPLSDLDNMVPAYGSWKMKYNKKMSLADERSIWSYVPGYAL